MAIAASGGKGAGSVAQTGLHKLHPVTRLIVYQVFDIKAIYPEISG
jgi:hypothetical protein